MALLPCSQVECEENATHVVAETDRLCCLFGSGAGLMCDKHSAAILAVGGIRLSMPAFAEAVRREQGS